MALFKVNTGCREQEVCQLRWEWEVYIAELKVSVFLVPAYLVKNKEDRLVILNKIAFTVLQEVRGQHPEFVFTYKGTPVKSMNNTAWQRAGTKQA